MQIQIHSKWKQSRNNLKQVSCTREVYLIKGTRQQLFAAWILFGFSSEIFQCRIIHIKISLTADKYNFCTYFLLLTKKTPERSHVREF